MPDKGSGSPRRILWIAYVFPPIGGNQGVGMSRYLAEITRADPNVSIDVLTVDPDPAVPQYDQTLVAALPASVRVRRVRAGVLHRLRYRRRLDKLAVSLPPGWRRAIVLGVIHLSTLAWIPRAAGLLWREREHRYDGVYTFVDPSASVLLALVARWLHPGAKVVLDYGDPRIPCRRGPRPLLAAAESLERRALLQCGAALFRTQEVIQLYQSHYPAVPASHYRVLPCGVDWEAYDAVPVPEGGEEFRIVYTGTVYADSVDPSPFLQAVATVAADAARITVLMAGAPDPDLVRLTRELGLGRVVSFRGHVPAGDVPAIQRSATLLLAFGFAAPYKQPSKLTEYVAARVPILYVAGSLTEPGARFVTASRRGFVVPNHARDIAETIQHARALWERGELSRCFDLSRTGELSWARGARQIFSLLQGGPFPGMSGTARR